MPDGQSLEFSGVTKRFGAITAVEGLTARVEPGRVTGFLGPNGAGKTTTLRILLGLVRATEGHATIGGRRYADLDTPLQTVGAVLEASSFHPGRTAAAHLTIYAQAAGIARSRVGEVLGLVGLTDAANRKVGGFSLGMRQRLGLAYALLGDPGVLVLDEPANGLDPEGIRWMRGFLRQLAGEGRTVLVSSHLLAEVQQTVDALLIISRGRLVFQGEVDELTDPDESATIVDAPDRPALMAALQESGVPFEVLRSGLTVRGVDAATVGAAAAASGVALSSLHRRGPALEEVFLDLVNGTRVHPSATGAVDAMASVQTTPPREETEADAAPAAAPADVHAAEAEGVEDETVEVAEGADTGAERVDAAAVVEGDTAPDETAHEDARVDRAPAPATFAVAGTGVIDIVPPPSEQHVSAEPDVDAEAADDIAEDPWAPEDADPDVDAIGAIDDELSTPEPVDTEDDRPWENFVKTDADVEADAFFASFDTGESEQVREPEPGAEPEPEAESEPPGVESGAERSDHEGSER